MSGGLTSGAGLSMLATDEDGEMKTASIEQLLGIGLMAALGLAAKRKFFPKRPVKVNTRKNGTKFTAEDTPNEVHQSNVSRVINDDITYLPPTKVQNMVRSAKELVGSWLTPLSRQAKQINPVISSIFRKYEQELAGTRKLWKDSTLPFWQQLQKVIPKGHDDASLLKLAYLNRDTQTIEQLAGKYGVNFSQHGNYAKQTREIHRQAVEEAGIDMGFFEDYNPRKLKRNAYQQFRKELEKRGMKSELNAIDEAMLDYAKKNGMGVEELSEWERAAITSKVLSNDMKNPLGGKGDFSKQRQIGKVEKWMLPYYENPLESVQKYVDEAAFKISARKFLGKQLKYAPGDQAAKLKELEGGIKDSYQSSVGSGVQVSDSLAGKIAEAIGRQQDLNLNNEQIVRLQKIIQERFKGTGGNEFLDGMRTFNYFGTIGNFGTTITQLMDLVNVGWFAGWDNATQAAFRRGQRDFFSEMGLDTNNGVDWSMTSGGMNKALDKVLTWTGFNKLDKWAKNTALNALYKKWSSKARKDEVGTLAELTERYGKEDAPAILEQLKNWDGSIDGNTPTPKEIQYLLFDQASDFLPISRLEMPEAAGGTYGPLLFQLKSYLVKQLDIYREITEKDLTRANELYKQGRKAEAAKLGAKAAGKWSLYAATLMASGASTDAIKDKAYGRPVELDEIIQNNLLRLALINRYHRYQLEREGIGKTALGMVMPATTVFDRISKDMTAFAKGEQVKGHSLQGTILDPIYWYVEGMGGYEKKNK